MKRVQGYPKAAWNPVQALSLHRIQVPSTNHKYGGEVRAKKYSLTCNLGTNGLKVTSEPPPMAGQAGCLQGQDRSAVTHPSSSHARRCLIRLSCDNRCTCYTAPLAIEWFLTTIKILGDGPELSEGSDSVSGVKRQPQRNCTGVVTWLSYQPYQRKTPELYPPSDKIFHSSIENGLKNATDG
ncbi:hypothetical protein J6590_097376, partial [Homalodisca vitripennis]